jgi:hypothetical protein
MGRFTKGGVSWFAKHVFLEDIVTKRQRFEEELAELEKRADARLYASPLIQPLDINRPEDVAAIAEIIAKNKESAEFWAFWMGQFCVGARQALADGNATEASWAAVCAERCRAMLTFKDHLEEVVWMGNSARRIIDALNIWSASKNQSDEEFWQLTFKEHSYVLSQVFAVPVVFIGEKAYVGGMTVDRQDAKFVDYLFSAESSRESILVEIKAPTTKLLGGRYRKGVYAPSSELSGAIVQLLSYRTALVSNLTTLNRDASMPLHAFRPRCVLVAGNAETQLNTDERRRAFELFRTACDAEVITYDELFRKVEILAQLFGLARKEPLG